MREIDSQVQALIISNALANKCTLLLKILTDEMKANYPSKTPCKL